MRTRALAIVLLAAGFLAGPVARAEIVVIVHPSNPVSNLSRDQVIDLYMGRVIVFPGGGLALPLDQSPGSDAQRAFYQGLIGRSVAEVKAWWARLLFTGAASPPRALPSAAAVLKTVRENPNAIAYIDSGDVDERVKIVYRLK